MSIFCLEDIRNAIRAANEASSATAEAAMEGDADGLKYWRRGYRAALITLALAFGLSPAIIDGDGNKLLPAWHIVEKKEVEYYE
jgi:hypothetical protein